MKNIISDYLDNLYTKLGYLKRSTLFFKLYSVFVIASFIIEDYKYNVLPSMISKSLEPNTVKNYFLLETLGWVSIFLSFIFLISHFEKYRTEYFGVRSKRPIIIMMGLCVISAIPILKFHFQYVPLQSSIEYDLVTFKNNFAVYSFIKLILNTFCLVFGITLMTHEDDLMEHNELQKKNQNQKKSF